MTCIYVRYNNLKRTGQLRNVWVEFGFGTVWGGGDICVTVFLCYCVSLCCKWKKFCCVTSAWCAECRASHLTIDHCDSLPLCLLLWHISLPFALASDSIPLCRSLVTYCWYISTNSVAVLEAKNAQLTWNGLTLGCMGVRRAGDPDTRS